MVTSKAALDKLIANGTIPKERFWVGYKPSGNVDEQCEWIMLVFDGKKTLLDNWIKTRHKTSDKHLRALFPPGPEEHAVKVYQELCETTNGKKEEYKKLAENLHRQWQSLQ